jgi:hypothetical protein
VLRDEFGNIESVVLPYINIAGTRSAALDLEVAARQDSRWGEFGLRLRATRTLQFDVQLLPTLPETDTLGASGRPRWRGELRLDWERGAHGASRGVSHIAGYGFCEFVRRGNEARNPDCDVRVASHTELDAQWRWRAPWRGEFALGGRNLRDRPPAFDPFGGFAYGLYDVNGRVWYLHYRQGF